MIMDLKGKRALVGGSTQGIGKACAIELAELGASVTLVARNKSRLEETVQSLPSDGNQRHDFLVADFNFPDQLNDVLLGFEHRGEISILVNNTGGPPPGLVSEANLADLSAAFACHVLCNQVLVQKVVEGMKARKYGRIINVISTSVKMPVLGLGVSNTIRGAVANWSKTLAAELGPYGITVNNVLPGATMTGRLLSVMESKAVATGKSMESIKTDTVREIPAGRIGDPHEVAAAIAFLATPAAAYINGINIPVDGGRTGCL